jgi:hypothetical protein
MKTLSLITAAFILLFSTVVSRGANVDRISAETGVAVATLQAERASTGLGWGGLEKAHLLATASGQSFDTIVSKFQAGEGWGKIAHDYGLNLGKVVSSARRSSKPTLHAKNNHTRKVHGKSGTSMGRGHTGKMSTSFHGMSGMGQGMEGMGHGGRGR